MREIKEGVQAVINNWYNNIEADIIHYWEQDDTWFVIIRYQPSTVIHSDRVEIKMDFARIFPSYRIEGEYHISIDKTVNV